MRTLFLRGLAWAMFGVVWGCGAEVIEADVCIYGGTSGGVAAAVQASRMGKTVVVAGFGRHLGGLSSGGLGATDNRGLMLEEME